MTVVILETAVFRDLLALAIISQRVTESTTPEDMASITATAYTLANAAIETRMILGYQ